MRFRLNILITLGCLALLMLAGIRSFSPYQYSSEQVVDERPISNIILLQALAGPIPGLVSDYQVLQVFSLLDTWEKDKQSKYARLIETRLKNASLLDPLFFDVYRLSSSILAYDLNMPEEAVAILDFGSQAAEGNWEIPFFAGYIAHELLHDDEKAFMLMSRVLNSPQAPPLAVNLAARYLNNTQNKEDVLNFLYLQLQVLPRKYHRGINAKISKLLKSGEL